MNKILSLAAIAALTTPVAAQQIDPDLKNTPQQPVFSNSGQMGGGIAMTGLSMRTTGADNFSAGDFYQVKNNSSVPVSEVTIDISIVAGAFFDFDGSAGYGLGLAPEITFVAGMAAGDVTWNFIGTGPNVITAMISPPMAPGAEFHFGADTDFFLSDPCSGDNFGAAPASLTAVAASGDTCTSDFSISGATESMADCPLGGLTLFGPFPGTAGAVNTLRFQGAIPGAGVALTYGFTGGATAVPPCPGLFLDIASANLLSIVGASASGDGSYSQFVPASVAGTTVLLQAADLTACVTSNLITYTF